MMTDKIKHKAVWDWLYSCNEIQGLYFIQGEYNDSHELVLNNQVVYTPTATGIDNWDKRYLRDKGIKTYSFYVAQYAPLISHVNGSANILVVEAFEKITHWIEEQAKVHNYPQFPADCKILKVDVQPGTIAGADDKGVKLQFITTIKYEQK